jgi:hypothetical protein
MGTGRRDRFSIGQDTHIVPMDFRVSKARPSVGSRFLHKVMPRSIDWYRKEQPTRVAVVKENWQRFSRFLLQKGGRVGPIVGAFRIVPIEIANAIGNLGVAIPAQIGLYRAMGSAVFFLAHDAFIASDAGWVAARAPPSLHYKRRRRRRRRPWPRQSSGVTENSHVRGCNHEQSRPL